MNKKTTKMIKFTNYRLSNLKTQNNKNPAKKKKLRQRTRKYE